MTRTRRLAAFLSLMLLALAMLTPGTAAAQDRTPPQTDLPIGLTPDELARLDEIGAMHRSTPPAAAPVRNPGEFEPMTGCIVRYSYGFGVPTSMLAEISEDITVWVIVANSTQESSASSELSSAGANMSNVDYIYGPTDSIWTRDYGPWFIIDGSGDQGIVDHVYNRPRPNDDLIPGVIGADWGVPVYGMDIEHTGGNYMSDGRGVAMSTELTLDENTSLTEAEIDSIMNAYLGIERYEKLGYIESGGIHHIDCWAKFLSPGKIILKEVDPGHSSYAALEARADYLESLMSSWGSPYEVVRVYAPNDEPYTNSLILNDKVLVPMYGTSNDAAAIATYEAAMPGYQILGFTGSWLTDDAIHCRGMGVTDRYMLYIDHVPLFDTANTSEDYRVGANIIDYSEQGLVTDSLLVYWQTDGSPVWTPVVMSSAGGDSFYADIPAQTAGTEVSYYVFAKDNSGRREHLPYVAPGDVFSFEVIVDTEAPVVTHTPLGDQTAANWPPTVSATITDNLEISSAVIEWTLNGSPQTDIVLERIPSTSTYEGTFTGTASVGYDIEYRIIAEDGATNSVADPPNGMHEFGIVDAIAVVVWEPDPTPITSYELLPLLDALDVSYDYTTTMPDFGDYQSAFICLGVYSYNYSLSTSEANAIVAFLNAGGKVYMEGGDCWAYDSARTIYNPYFGVAGMSDGSGDISNVEGVAGTMCEGMSFAYSGGNSYMDHINPQTGAVRIFTNPADGAGCGVSKDAGSYQTVACAFEFGGLVDGTPSSTKEELLVEILEFFGVYNTGVPEGEPIIEKLALRQNTPNPFNPTTEIAFDLPETAEVELAVYDVAGRKVATLVDGITEPGRHRASWNGTDDAGRSVASGVYFFRLSRNGEAIVRKGVLLK
jgi:agmatine/peptidylarginine deiminase